MSPSVVIDFVSAFASFLNGSKVLLARDTRTSSPMLHSAALSALLSAGVDVLDMGICPTPVMQYSVSHYGAAGGISISGGHNAMGWNSVSLVGPDGAFLDPVGGENVLERFHAYDFVRADWANMGTVQAVDEFVSFYFKALQEYLNVDAIREAGFRVVIDPVCGAGCHYIDEYARRLGFQLVPINARPSGYLPREAEPRPRSALQMASVIRLLEGDVGFVLSSDMNRLSFVTEDAEPASEEYTFAVITNHILNKRSGPVLTNCCTTRTIDDIAKAHGVPVLKTPVGQAFVVSAVQDEAGVIGGEGSGSVVLPDFSHAFDGFLMMGLILEAMAESRATISELLSDLPRYSIIKRHYSCDSARGYLVLEQLKEKFAGMDVEMDETDGLRLDWSDGWIHVRPSRTQQMIRVISEAQTRIKAQQRADEVSRIIEVEL